CGADAIAVQVGGARRPVERQQLFLPGPPARDVEIARRLEAVLQARQRAMAGFFGASAETQRKQRASGIGLYVDPAAQRDIAVLGAAIALVERAVARQQLPSVRCTDVADRTGKPGHR